MKMNCASIKLLGGSMLVGMLVLDASAASPAGPASGSLTVERATDGASSLVTISNASDEVWVLKRSSNLVDWVEIEAIKIHNGRFRRAVAGLLTVTANRSPPTAQISALTSFPTGWSTRKRQ